MMVHLFGGTSSPSCANFALRRTAEDNKTNFDKETIETVYKNFYMDDALKSVESEDKAIRLAHQLRNLLLRGGFNLTKWLSNSRNVIESVPEECRASQVKSLDFEQLPIEREYSVYHGMCNQTGLVSSSPLRIDQPQDEVFFLL